MLFSNQMSRIKITGSPEETESSDDLFQEDLKRKQGVSRIIDSRDAISPMSGSEKHMELPVNGEPGDDSSFDKADLLSKKTSKQGKNKSISSKIVKAKQELEKDPDELEKLKKLKKLKNRKWNPEDLEKLKWDSKEFERLMKELGDLRELRDSNKANLFSKSFSKGDKNMSISSKIVKAEQDIREVEPNAASGASPTSGSSHNKVFSKTNNNWLSIKGQKITIPDTSNYKNKQKGVNKLENKPVSLETLKSEDMKSESTDDLSSIPIKLKLKAQLNNGEDIDPETLDKVLEEENNMETEEIEGSEKPEEILRQTILEKISGGDPSFMDFVMSGAKDVLLDIIVKELSYRGNIVYPDYFPRNEIELANLKTMLKHEVRIALIQHYDEIRDRLDKFIEERYPNHWDTMTYEE